MSNSNIDSNRQNATHSTGPRTEAGKARSSQNATRAGWFARTPRFATPAQQQLYTEFESAWLAELQPAGVLELESFQNYVRAAWHLREIIEAQNQHTVSGPAAFLDDTAARTLDRLHRYERDFERRAARHLRELRRLQTERAARAHLPAASLTAAGAAPLATAKSLTPPKQSQPDWKPDFNADLLSALLGPKPATGPPIPSSGK